MKNRRIKSGPTFEVCKKKKHKQKKTTDLIKKLVIPIYMQPRSQSQKYTTLTHTESEKIANLFLQINALCDQRICNCPRPKTKFKKAQSSEVKKKNRGGHPCGGKETPQNKKTSETYNPTEEGNLTGSFPHDSSGPRSSLTRDELGSF